MPPPITVGMAAQPPLGRQLPAPRTVHACSHGSSIWYTCSHTILPSRLLTYSVTQCRTGSSGPILCPSDRDVCLPVPGFVCGAMGGSCQPRAHSAWQPDAVAPTLPPPQFFLHAHTLRTCTRHAHAGGMVPAPPLPHHALPSSLRPLPDAPRMVGRRASPVRCWTAYYALLLPPRSLTRRATLRR